MCFRLANPISRHLGVMTCSQVNWSTAFLSGTCWHYIQQVTHLVLASSSVHVIKMKRTIITVECGAPPSDFIWTPSLFFSWWTGWSLCRGPLCVLPVNDMVVIWSLLRIKIIITLYNYDREQCPTSIFLLWTAFKWSETQQCEDLDLNHYSQLKLVLLQFGLLWCIFIRTTGKHKSRCMLSVIFDIYSWEKYKGNLFVIILAWLFLFQILMSVLLESTTVMVMHIVPTHMVVLLALVMQDTLVMASVVMVNITYYLSNSTFLFQMSV